MKKLYLFILVLFCLMITGCGSNETREASTLDTFKEVATNDGFLVSDKLSEYQDQGITYITGSFVAKMDDVDIEMVTYDSEESAKKTVKKHLESFKIMKSSGATGSADKGKNFEKHTMITNGFYMITSRIDNTLIFSKTAVSNKEKVDKLFKDMGY